MGKQEHKTGDKHMTCNEGQNKVQNEALEQIYTRQGKDKIIEGGLRIH